MYKVEIGAATPEIVIIAHEINMMMRVILPPCPASKSVPRAINSISDSIKMISDITRNLKYFWLHMVGVDG